MVLEELSEQITDPGSHLLESVQDTQTVSLSQKAYEQIRRKIIELELRPGSIIDESQMQHELGLGRTPIREALLRLSFQKLVTILPRRGIFVADIGITDLQQIFEVRITLEALAARLAAQRGGESHWTQIEAILDRLTLPYLCDTEELTSFDEACHRVIYEASGNEILQDTLSTLYALSRRLWCYLSVTPEEVQSWLTEHREVLDALRAKDSARASNLVEQHVRSFQESIQAVLLGASQASKTQ